MSFPTEGELEALRRCFTRAEGQSGGQRRVRKFLLSWYNATAYGGFDFADLWEFDEQYRGDVVTVIKMIARGPSGWYPDRYGFGDEIKALAEMARKESEPDEDVVDGHDMNREGLTWEEWFGAATLGGREVSLELYQQMRKGWDKGEDPTEYAAEIRRRE